MANTKNILLFGLILIIFLSGCTSDTPRGDIKAPVQDQNSITVQSAPEPTVKDNQPSKTSFSIGEPITVTHDTTKTKLQLTLEKVTRFDNCSSDGGCIGAFVKVENLGEDKESDYFSGSVMLDDAGKQYETVSFCLYCPEKYDTGLIFPGAKKEGYIYFDDVSKAAKKIKLILSLGIFNSSNLIYLIDYSSIKDAVKSAEITLSEIPVSCNTYFGCTVDYIKGSIKNNGESSLLDLKYDYKIVRADKTFDEGKDKTLISTIEPGKEAEINEYISSSNLLQGDYTLEFTLKDKSGEIAKVTKQFTVQTTG